MAIKNLRHDAVAVVVHASQSETLVHKVKFMGAQGSFVVNDNASGNHLLSSSDPKVPGTADTWSRTWPLATDPTSNVTDQVALFTYIGGATQYTYTVELRTGAVAKPVVDIDYAGAATDNDFHSLKIFVV